MPNWITKDTWELWAENIEYIIDHTEEKGTEAYHILTYLEGEGAFTLKEEEN